MPEAEKISSFDVACGQITTYVRQLIAKEKLRVEVNIIKTTDYSGVQINLTGTAVLVEYALIASRIASRAKKIFLVGEAQNMQVTSELNRSNKTLSLLCGWKKN